MEYLRGISTNNKNAANIILATKAVEIFFYKLIRNKTLIANPKADSALELLVDQLLSLQKKVCFNIFYKFIIIFKNILTLKKDKFKPYSEFFNKVAMELLSSLFSLHYFEHQLILTLFPSSFPILEKITLLYLDKFSLEDI